MGDDVGLATGSVGRRRLGAGGPVVSEISLGCMSMSEFYGPSDEAESVAAIAAALEVGIDTLDTADSYGPFRNEVLVGRALSGRRHAVTLCTKFGIVRGPNGEHLGLDTSPAYARRACEASLRRLGTDHVDVYYVHRVDGRTPIEETVGALSELVQAGMVRFIGLSEVSPETLRRAHSVHPVAAVQCEFSLWARDSMNELEASLVELDVAMVAYSPLGRGFLAGAVRSPNDLASDDFRRSVPRFQAENLERNLQLLAELEAMAAGKRCSAAQLALAWVLASRSWVVPLVGCRKPRHVRENAAASSVRLSPADLDRLDRLFSASRVAGARRSRKDTASQI